MMRKKVVAYCRISTLEQRKGYGISIQKELIKRFAKQQKLKIDAFYIDEAESGVEEDRKELNRLIEACEKKEIKAIIISSLDRLSRNVRFAENLFHYFEKNNVSILIVDMPHYNGKDSKDVLVRQIREAIAEENRKEIIDRLKKGREERVKKGRPAGGNVPYGYTRIKKTFRKNSREVIIIKKIYLLREKRMSGKQIADNLNSIGCRLRNGNRWTQRQVWSILNNSDLYREGIIRYGKITGKDRKLIILDDNLNNIK